MLKKQNKTQEQLVKEMENKKEIERKRDIIVNEFYPALIDATVSVDEAKALISAMGNVIMEDVLGTMKERKFEDIMIKVHGILTQDGERQDEIKRLLNTLKGENLYVAREIVEGMTRAIETMIMTDMRGRKLDTLNPDWDKYLN